MMVINSILRSEPVLPRNIKAEVSEDLQTVCLTALRKNRELRYASAEKLAKDLERILRGDPPLLISSSTSHYFIYAAIVVIIIYIWMYIKLGST